jgi:Animal haem peroxidase
VNKQQRRAGQLSRRKFLASVATVAAASSIPAVARAQRSRPPRFVIREDRFGRMFPDLDPFFRDNSSSLQAAMREIGKRGGMLDANDKLDDGGEAAATALIADPNLSLNNPNNPAHTAGTTFMGQFLDHDMTFDLNSRLAVVTEPTASPNERTPALDLDSVYGGGPRADQELYQSVARGSRDLPTKLRIESGGRFEDVPRNRDRSAIIADPRNDENMMISGLQTAFILHHNKCVDHVRERDRRLGSEEVYERARQLTTWHYQWIIVHEFLPLFIGQSMVDDILRNGRRFYRPSVPFIPVEFQGAAYRFGHTLVRPSYRANLNGDNDNGPFFGMIFDPSGEGQSDPVDLRGGARARRRFIDWQTFFDFGPTFTDGPGNTNPAIRPNKLIDTKISSPMFRLPIGAIAGGVPGDEISLPSRNLLRHITWGIPSGQSIARAMGAPVLSGENDSVLKELGGFGFNLGESTPLWFYVLREGFVLGNGGRHLGPVGGRIVGEVFIGLLQLDRDSYLNARGWRPTLPTRGGRVTGDYKMIDLLTFAGVDPTSRSGGQRPRSTETTGSQNSPAPSSETELAPPAENGATPPSQNGATPTSPSGATAPSPSGATPPPSGATPPSQPPVTPR